MLLDQLLFEIDQYANTERSIHVIVSELIRSIGISDPDESDLDSSTLLTPYLMGSYKQMMRSKKESQKESFESLGADFIDATNILYNLRIKRKALKDKVRDPWSITSVYAEINKHLHMLNRLKRHLPKSWTTWVNLHTGPSPSDEFKLYAIARLQVLIKALDFKTYVQGDNHERDR